MASTKKKMTIMAAVLLVILLSSWTTTKAEDMSGGETCFQALIRCAPYLGFTPYLGYSDPPAFCCDTLKMAIQTQLPCLCAVIKDPTIAAMLNMTQVFQLPQYCGIKDVGPSMCTTQGGTYAPQHTSVDTTIPPSAATSSSSSKTPPSPPLGNASSSRSIALAGPISSLLLLFTVLTFY